jgi:hypothetical protein
MPDPLLEFDPVSEDAANSPLEVWSTATYGVTRFNAPSPPSTVQWASSVDTEGSLPSSRKHENRTLSLTVEVASAAGLRTLQAKAAKVAREGGTAKLTLPASGEVVIFDLLATDSFAPSLDILFFSNSGAYCVVEWELTAKPYGRGAEIDLGDNTETTLPLLVFTDTGIKGDMPALGRLVVDNDEAGSTQGLIRWGIQSRYYSNAATAALFYQAESCAMSAAAAAAGPAGASGGGSNTALYGSLPAAPSWTSLIYIGTSSTAQTHIGSFRVFARVRAPSANTGTVSLRASWSPSLGTPQVHNASTAIYTEDAWYMVDLGQVTIPKAVGGATQGWLGTIDGQSTVSGDDVYIDWVALFPVDEGFGEDLNFTSSHQIAASGSVQVRHDGAFASRSGGYLPPLVYYEGDYLRLPPAGAEARTLRVIVKLARGDTTLFDPGTAASYLDPSIDDISARLFYTPRYLVVPEP